MVITRAKPTNGATMRRLETRRGSVVMVVLLIGVRCPQLRLPEPSRLSTHRSVEPWKGHLGSSRRGYRKFRIVQANTNWPAGWTYRSQPFAESVGKFRPY